MEFKEYKRKNTVKLSKHNPASHKTYVRGSVIKLPLGFIPKKIHDKLITVERFNEVCGTIARYYNAGMKITIDWIEEYNELVENVSKYYRYLAHMSIIAKNRKRC